MSAASKQITAVSFRGVQVLALNSLGVPDASGTTEYAGVRFVGAKAMTLNVPERRTVVNTGDDRVLAQFSLPAQEGVTGELRVGSLDMLAEELITGVSIKTAGQQQWLHSPGQVLQLPKVCLLGWRVGKSIAAGDDGRAHYEVYLVHSATVSPRGGDAGEGASEERTQGIVADVVSRLVWGEALVEATDGVAQTEYSMGSLEYVPRLSAFAADGTAVAFPLGKEAVSTDKMKVYTWDGTTFTDVTSTVTLAVGSVTFALAPASGLYVICLIEVAS